MFQLRPFWWWHADTRGAEVLSAIIAWATGALLLYPAMTFEKSPSYGVMASFASEVTWGAGYVAVGLLQSAAMCGNVHLLRYPSALLATIAWCATAALVAAANPWTNEPLVYAALAASQAWVCIKGPQDHG